MKPRLVGLVVAIVVLVVSTLIALSAHAQQRVPLTLAEAEDLALADEPGQAALFARASAFEEQAGLTAADQLIHGRHVGRDDRRSRCERLDHAASEGFMPNRGKHEQLCIGDQR